MRHPTPLAALDTLEHELAALAADVPRPGAGLESRLDVLLTLVPVLGEAARLPTFAADRGATVQAFARLERLRELLAERLRHEMERLRQEIAQAAVGGEAMRRYGATAAAVLPQLDRVG